MFKYLKEIFVHYNYVDRNFLINFDKVDSEGNKPFRHLIITGKNGSGKTKILEALNEEMSNVICGKTELLTQNTYGYAKHEYPEFSHPRVSVEFYEEFKKAIKNNNFVYAYLGTDRNFKVTLDKNGNLVETLDKHKQEYQVQIDKYNSVEPIPINIESVPSDKIKPIFKPSLSKYFLQFLFEKKDKHAYAIMDGEDDLSSELTDWFDNLNQQFKFIFENNDIELKHKRISSNNRKFYFELPNGRTFNFDQLSHGYNNIFAIVAEIWLHIEAYQAKHPNDMNPRGLVIIDELETHLHLSLQEKILPFLTGLFPNIQFIIATHSPVIMASETDCVIFDLDEKYTEKDNITGTSYTVLMESHLGLGSEYSLAVTKDLNRARDLIQIKDRNEKEEKELRQLAKKLGDLSPTLALEIILAIEKYAEAE